MEPTTENPQSNHPGVAPDEVSLKFDSPEAVGTISLRRHAYGAEILVDGIEIGLVDLFHRASRGDEAAPDFVQRGSVALHVARVSDSVNGDDYTVRLYHHCKQAIPGPSGNMMLWTTVIQDPGEAETTSITSRELDHGEQPWKP